MTGDPDQIGGFRRIAVLGLGLIGGSLLRRLVAYQPAGGKRNVTGYEVVGYDSDPRTRLAVARSGHPVASALPDAVADADLVVVATPLRAIPDLLPDLAAVAPADAVVTDVASVKVPVADAMRAAGLGHRHVGGHPMAGTERSGFEASDPALFDGASWVLCLPDRSIDPDSPDSPAPDLAGWLALARLVTALGCRVVPTSAVAHDAAVARISGLPHVLAAALAATGASSGLATALAAGSFRDGTRVAGTRPDLAAMLCDANRAAVAEAVQEMLDRLTAARDLLRAGASVLPLCSEGHTARERWQSAGLGGVSFDLDRADPALCERLDRLGSGGGHVAAVAGRTVRCWRPAHAEP